MPHVKLLLVTEFTFKPENRPERLNDDEQAIHSLAADKNPDRN